MYTVYTVKIGYCGVGYMSSLYVVIIYLYQTKYDNKQSLLWILCVLFDVYIFVTANSLVLHEQLLYRSSRTKTEMSLTKLSMARNDLIIPSQGEFG